MYTSLGVGRQVGMEAPADDRRKKPKNRSCGVSLVAVYKKERTECNASGRTSCQFLSGRFLDFKLIVTAFHITPLHLSA